MPYRGPYSSPRSVASSGTRALPLQPGSRVAIWPRLQNGGGTIAFLLHPWQLLSLELK
jgi:hypothetical protein